MAELPVIPRTARVANMYRTADATFANVFHVDTGGETDPSAIASTVQDAWMSTGSVINMQSPAVNMSETAVTMLDGITPTANVPYLGTNVGTATGNPVAAQAAMIVTLYTLTRGRSWRGRMYFGGVTQNLLSTTGGSWTTTGVGDMQSRFGVFQSKLSDLGGLSLVVASYKHGVATLVDSYKPRRYVGTIRRRAEREEVVFP